MKYVGDLEKRGRQFGGNYSVKNIGNLEKRGRRFGENCSAKNVGDLEKRGGAVMAILYWSSLRSSLELGDHKWRLNRNGEKMETNYGDQNFIHHKVESTYLECFKGRNV